MRISIRGIERGKEIGKIQGIMEMGLRHGWSREEIMEELQIALGMSEEEIRKFMDAENIE